MTNEIIEMAREAGLCHDINNGIYLCAPMHLERFAKLVAAAEREACAAVAREWVEAYPHPSGIIANNIMARGKHEAI